MQIIANHFMSNKSLIRPALQKRLLTIEVFLSYIPRKRIMWGTVLIVTFNFTPSFSMYKPSSPPFIRPIADVLERAFIACNGNGMKNGEKYVVYDYILENRDQLKRIPPNGRVVKRESNKIDDIKIKGILGMEI